MTDTRYELWQTGGNGGYKSPHRKPCTVWPNDTRYYTHIKKEEEKE